MPLYDDFPYTNFHSLNLDWIVKKLSELENGESTEESSSTATLARNLTGNYPYTNFHALNLDWVIRSMLELESDFETLESDWQNLSTTGLLNDQVKNAILQCFQNVAWINDQGQLYYNTLHDLFFPPVIVSTLTAVLDQGEKVFYVGEDIANIKDYLTVTAELSDSTTITVPATQYILTGSLSHEGPNIITVTYMNASTTITVNAEAVTLVSISAVYTQSGTVYDTDTLDSLKSDLVVTATYNDSSTATVPSADYTLSGTLTEGTSTITVTYEGLTATFNVTVTVDIGLMYSLYNQSYAKGVTGTNTNLKLLETDQTFTILFDGVQVAQSTSDGNRVFVCVQPSSPYKGLYFGSTTASGNNRTEVQYFDATNYIDFGRYQAGRIRILCSHVAGSGSTTVMWKTDSDVTTFTLSNTFTAHSGNLVVAGTASSTTNTWVGTLNKFEVYSKILEQNEIDDFFEVS